MRALVVAVGLGLALGGAASAHQGHSRDAAAWHSCEAQPVGESCSFTVASGDLHRGTCRQIQGSMMCVRNQPVVAAGPGGANPALWISGGFAVVGVLGMGLALRGRRADQGEASA